jgi:hypothetical protein
VSTTISPPGRSRCRRRTLTTARTAEQSQATSSAPLAAAISAALSSLPSWGVNAASAAMSAAVWAAALAPASAPTSTAATPASSTNPANASPTRVAPPSSGLSGGVQVPGLTRAPLVRVSTVLVAWSRQTFTVWKLVSPWAQLPSSWRVRGVTAMRRLATSRPEGV